MYLKSLTLKGFKSFASSTSLRFEPGITAVVGPNGSGKSNVVDAISWVLGEQGAKALRGGKMDDVIFAGTADRAPLGRAEVTLTIDNSDGALPIAFSEVSITRRMFRDGAGEYEINGKACRLLDIQELLSDSGIGRGMHVIVSQGHLDSILAARPEDRRGFIEEAAGVLKHRKRKEKALRKLNAMRANLTRLTDLTTELRRQLGPLGRQAEVARRAAGVQSDLRDAKLRLLADDAATLQAEIDADHEAEQAAVAHRAAIAAQLADAQAAQEAAAADVAQCEPALKVAQNAHFRLSALAERFRGTTSLAAERAQHLSQVIEPSRSGRDPQELERAADDAEAEQAGKDTAVATARDALTVAEQRRAACEEQLAGAEKQLRIASSAAADRREGLARLTGQVNTARSRQAATDDELERIEGAIGDATQRGQQAHAEFEALRESVGDLDSSETDLDERHQAAASAAETAAGRVAELGERRRQLQADDTRLAARIEALSLSLDIGDGAGAIVQAGEAIGDILGPASSILDVAAGAETAIAAALGPAAEAMVVGGFDTAMRALDHLKMHEDGRSGLLYGVDEPTQAWSSAHEAVTLPPGCAWARDLVSAPARVAPVVDRLLDGIVVVDDLAHAALLLRDAPELTAITRDGDILGFGWAFGGSVGRQTVIEIQAAVDDAARERAELENRIIDVDAALAGAQSEASTREAEAQQALAALYESDAKINAVSEQLAQLGGAARSAQAEVDRLTVQRDAAEKAQREIRETVADLEIRLTAAQSEQPPDTLDSSERDRLAAQASAERQSEVAARLALRTAEERARATAGAAEDLRRAARAARQADERNRQQAQHRRQAAALARRIVDASTRASEMIGSSVTQAAKARSRAESDRDEATRAASDARTVAADLQMQWDRLTDSVHSTEVLRAGQRTRLDQLAQTARDDYAIDITELVAEFGPDQPVPPSAKEVAEYEQAKERGEQVSAPMSMPYDRPSTERRAKRAQRDLSTLGKVNPLALEEFAAMEERHQFLAAQLDDLKGTRKDLLDVITEVDEKILELFTSAYYDVAAEFKTVFEVLFPGGEGELLLTDPQDMLATGVDVTARPPGKKVKRLSLLSGGERSLVAVAMLVAIFRARPSPFYVLDEIEAALDEVNLTRLVGLLRELRDSSQLLVITHQKYTMEAADVLYGVSMRGDGISQVISQRLRTEDQPVALTPASEADAPPADHHA